MIAGNQVSIPSTMNPEAKRLNTAREANAFIYQSVSSPLKEAEIRELDEDYHKANEAYQAIAAKRQMFLRRK